MTTPKNDDLKLKSSAESLNPEVIDTSIDKSPKVIPEQASSPPSINDTK